MKQKQDFSLKDQHYNITVRQTMNEIGDPMNALIFKKFQLLYVAHVMADETGPDGTRAQLDSAREKKS